ncbi:MAG: hypothetical protein M3220_09745 [Chloroflexota bacterium]|nr:hypothetical protein [Chloroflexota bacterium]
MRRMVTWVLLAFLVAIFPPVMAQAQEPELTLEANALYEGTSKYGEWLPVTVNLENRGADVSGQAQVRVTTSSEETVYAQRLELPRGARKQVTIYTVPNNFSRRLSVEFVPEGADEPLVSEEVEVRPVPNVRFIVAAVSGGGDGLDAIAGVNFRGEQGPRDQAVLVPLMLDTLPDRPEALRTLDMIVFTGVDTSMLTPRQRMALEQYVRLGGMVLLGGGPEANRVLAGIPESLQSVILGGDLSLEGVPALEQVAGEPVRVNGPFPAALSEPMEESTVRFRQDDLPLVVERQVGRGMVYWLALDPALSPFDAWAGTDEFWLTLVGDRTAYPRDMPVDVSQRQMVNEQLHYALQNLPSLDLPSLRLLVPLLGLYILIVGPVNYFMLRRMRRLELAWVTIPIVTLLFSVGAYGLGFQLRGNDVILNQVAIVQGAPGSEGGYVRSVIGIFSPARRSYDLTVAGESLLSPSRVQGEPFGPAGSGGDRHAVIVQGEPTLVEDLTVNQWSMQGVTAESLATEGFAFDADLTSSNGTLVGMITNHSGYVWKDVVVVLGNNFERVGDIAPGESADLSFEATNAGNQFNGDIAWRIFEKEFNRPSGASREVQVRQQVLGSLFNGPFGMSALGGSNLPVLLAWLDAAPTEVSLVDGSSATKLGTTLLYSEMPVRFGSGTVSLPRGMMAARIVAIDGGTCYGPGMVSLAPDFREAEIQWELPNAVKGLDPSLLSLYVLSDGGWFSAPELLLYDYQQEAWVQLVDPVMGQNKLTAPDSYLSDNGIVHLRVENPSRNHGGCLFFDVSLEGKMLGAAQASR